MSLYTSSRPHASRTREHSQMDRGTDGSDGWSLNFNRFASDCRRWGRKGVQGGDHRTEESQITQTLTKFSQILIKMLNNAKIHIENIKECHFLTLKNPTPRTKTETNIEHETYTT